MDHRRQSHHGHPSSSIVTVKATGGNSNNGTTKKKHVQIRDPNDNDMHSTKQHGALITMDHFDALLDREIEEEEIENAIDSLWLDLLGIYLDCTLMKENLFMRGFFTPNYHKNSSSSSSTTTTDLLGNDSEEMRYHRRQIQQQQRQQQHQQHPSWFEKASFAYGHMDIKAQNRYYKSKKRSMNNNKTPIATPVANKTTTDENKFAFWNQMKRNFRDLQAPLSLSTQLCQRIAVLPERDVTLYIRLDEQVPHNSCTAYEVDWYTYLTRHCGGGRRDRGVSGSSSSKASLRTSRTAATTKSTSTSSFAASSVGEENGIKDNDDLFTVFRLCTRPKNASRTDCIVGTLASACLYPYAVVIPPTQAAIDNNKTAGPTKGNNKPQPFRPKRLLLDRPEDVCTNELQFYLRMMGLSECQEVSEQLRNLHDASELDFFPSNGRGCDFLGVPSVADVLVNAGDANLFNIDDDNNNKNNNIDKAVAIPTKSRKPPGTCTTSLPFMCLDDDDDDDDWDDWDE